MHPYYLKLLFPAILAFMFFACDKDDPEKIWEKDKGKLLKYISENELQAIEHESGLFYVVEREGEGAHPTLQSRVHIRYTGRLLDDKIFDQSIGTTFTIANTITGWRIGIPLFKAGGKGKLLIPSALAYGQYPPFGSGIPRNACLIFDIEIVDMN